MLASALTMDKLKPKRVAMGAGTNAAAYAVLRDEADIPAALATVGLPMMVKPASQGSSVGISKVKSDAALLTAFREARAVDPVVFAERFIPKKKHWLLYGSLRYGAEGLGGLDRARGRRTSSRTMR